MQDPYSYGLTGLSLIKLMILGCVDLAVLLGVLQMKKRDRGTNSKLPPRQVEASLLILLGVPFFLPLILGLFPWSSPALVPLPPS